jgi:hypothetical protein
MVTGGANSVIPISYDEGDALGHVAANQQDRGKGLSFVNSFQVVIDVWVVTGKKR